MKANAGGHHKRWRRHLSELWSLLLVRSSCNFPLEMGQVVLHSFVSCSSRIIDCHVYQGQLRRLQCVHGRRSDQGALLSKRAQPLTGLQTGHHQRNGACCNLEREREREREREKEQGACKVRTTVAAKSSHSLQNGKTCILRPIGV